MPRILMICVVIFTNWVSTVWPTSYLFWPVLGWIFLPYTTLVYMFSHIKGDGIKDGWVILLILGVILDVSGIFGVDSVE
jgi:hypothetical protein